MQFGRIVIMIELIPLGWFTFCGNIIDRGYTCSFFKWNPGIKKCFLFFCICFECFTCKITFSRSHFIRNGWNHSDTNFRSNSRNPHIKKTVLLTFPFIIRFASRLNVSVITDHLSIENTNFFAHGWFFPCRLRTCRASGQLQKLKRLTVLPQIIMLWFFS